MSTKETVVVSRQVKPSTFVPAAWRYHLPFLIYRKLQTHIQNTPINIINVYASVVVKRSTLFICTLILHYMYTYQLLII